MRADDTPELKHTATRNTYKSDSENSISLKGYRGNLVEQQEKERERMQSLKSSTLRDFGIDGVCQGASSSSKKLHFDNAMLSHQEREIAKKKELRENTCHNDCNNDISDGNDHNVEQITV